MDVTAYVAGYEAFARRLPDLLARWDAFAPERQDALADELFRLIVRRDEAIVEATDPAAFAHIASADCLVRLWSREVEAAMGFHPSVSLARVHDAQASRYTVTALEVCAAAG